MTYPECRHTAAIVCSLATPVIAFQTDALGGTGGRGKLMEIAPLARESDSFVAIGRITKRNLLTHIARRAIIPWNFDETRCHP
jgi:hypothetical protein